MEEKRYRDKEQWRRKGANLKVRGSKFVLSLPKPGKAPKERNKTC
jgi:hypothetical protein